MPRLVVENGHDKGTVIPVPPKGTILVGRDTSAAYTLRDTMSSRLHFKIESKEDDHWIFDLESLNGTLVNGTRVREARLSNGDLIKVGETLFSYLSDDAAADPLIGQRIGGYRLLARVGRGGMGTVYKAEQVDLQRIVAIKVISEEHTKNKDFIDLFIHEARAAARLNHPYIVQVYDVKRHQNFYYFSMEYVSGGNVQELLEKTPPRPVEQTVRMILDAARGLDYAHQKGIVHRDIKPDNLMISETGSIKIGDMGLARGLEEKVGPDEESSVLGTPHYIAPEQVRGRPADFRSDLYSLGATMYRMLAGTTPYSAPSIKDLVNKKVREDATPLHVLIPEFPRRLSDIVARMMERDPQKRYQGMIEVIKDIEDFHRRLAGPGAEAPTSRITTVGTLVRDRKLLIGAIALLILVVVGGVTGAILFGRKPPVPEIAPPPPDAPPDAKLAEQMLENWKQTELQKMDKNAPRSIEKVMEGYLSVAEKFPGTIFATQAEELRADLGKRLRNLLAEKKLADVLDAEDAANFRLTVQSFQAKKLDLSPVDSTIAFYETFAKCDESRDTAAAAKAAARAGHIRKWKEAIEKRKAEFEKTLAEAQELTDARRFKEAWNALMAFQQATRDAELPCDFAKDRYRSLLYDAAAEIEAQNVNTKAQSEWIDAERAVRALAGDKDFGSALKILDSVLRNSLDEIAMKANLFKDDIEAQWAADTRRKAEAEAAAREARLQKAREAFERESAAARALFLQMDFRGALAKMKALGDANDSEEFRPRLERRTAELGRAAHLKENLVNIINAKDNPYGFKKEFKTGVADGEVTRADDKALQVSLRAGGTFDHPWSQFDGPAFCAFVRDHWKYNKDQMNRDPEDLCDLAVVCMEFGLYEQALQDIEYVRQTNSYAANESVRRFCDEYKERIENADSAEHEEIEAQKRLARIEGFMKTGNPDAARAEIELLRARFGRTKAYADRQKKVGEYLDKLNKDGSEEEKRKLKSAVFRRLQARVLEEQNAARKAQPDIVARLGRLDDPFERNVLLGSAYAAAAEWEKSSVRYQEAKRVGDASSREPVRNRLLSGVYAALYRNYVVNREKGAAEAVRAEASKRFVNADTGREAEWWTNAMGALQVWADRIYPAQEKGIERLKEEVRASPDNPQKVWALATAWMDGLQNMFEARGYLAYLLDNHPEFTEVQNGNCLYKMAEIQFAAREVREAVLRYRELQERHKGHPKVAEPRSQDGVSRRLDECYMLLNKMGYPQEKPK